MRDAMGGRTRVRERAWEFRRQVLGDFLDDDGLCGANPYHAQCVNLPAEWLKGWGILPPCGSAFEWAAADIRRMRWHPVGAGSRLRAGDVFVIPRRVDLPYGHVGVVMDGTRSPVWTLDQNWPLGAPVGDRYHLAADMIGVQRIYTL